MKDERKGKMYIGIVGTEKNGVFGINSNYMEWAANFGTPLLIPVMSPEEFLDVYSNKLNAIILPGGADIDTRRYKKFPGFILGKPDAYLEHFDIEILPKLIGLMPIFGICRGLQTINVLLGGTLKQHIWNHPYSSDDNDLVHEVVPVEEVGRWKVNSFHHQAIDKLSDKLTASLTDANMEIIEAISSKELRIRAVQFHPERSNDDWSKKFFQEIL